MWTTHNALGQKAPEVDFAQNILILNLRDPVVNGHVPWEDSKGDRNLALR